MSWPRPQSPAVAMMSKSEEKEESCKKTSEGEEMKHQAVNSLKYICRGKEGGSGSSSVVVPPTT